MNNDFTGLYITRLYNEQSDKAFVTSTFLKGLYYGGFFWYLIPKDIFMTNYKPVIEALLTSPNVVISVACAKEDPDIILGYSMLSADFRTIHWVYIKSRWRNRGIARKLLPQFPERVSHLTKLGLLLMNKFPNIIFNPFNLL